MRLQIQQQLVVAPRLGIVAQLVVPEREIVEALSPPLRRVAEDFAEQPDAGLLVGARRRLDEALEAGWMLARAWCLAGTDRNQTGRTQA